MIRRFHSLNAELDTQGRIARLALGSKITKGHAVCCVCGKDMPTCWDVICAGCGRAVCYDHAVKENDRWMCVFGACSYNLKKFEQR